MKAITLATLAALGLLTMSSNAFANDTHGYNGSYCKAYYGSQAAKFDHLEEGIRNNADYYLMVSCPVLANSVYNTSGTAQVYVHWTGRSSGTVGTVSCFLYSRNGNGTPRESKSASRSSTGWLYIANLTSDDVYGSYSMVCGLPARSTLNTIFLEEY